MEKIATQDAHVKCLRFSRNFGQHSAITAGLDYVQTEWTLVMDCDLQDPPEAISNLFAKAQEGYDVVVARRMKRKDVLSKRITSWIFYKTFSLLTGSKYDGSVGNYRIMHRKVVLPMTKMREELRFFGGMCEWLGFKAGSVDIQHAERFAGESSYNYFKLFRLAFHLILAYSFRPLKFTVIAGLGFSFFSFAFGAYLVFRKLVHGIPIEGWASLIVSVYLIGGLMLFALGIIGIYIGKIFSQVKQRPLYVLDETVNLPKGQQANHLLTY